MTNRILMDGTWCDMVYDGPTDDYKSALGYKRIILEPGQKILQPTQRRFLQWVVDNHSKAIPIAMVSIVLRRGSYYEQDKEVYNELRVLYLEEYENEI